MQKLPVLDIQKSWGKSQRTNNSRHGAAETIVWLLLPRSNLLVLPRLQAPMMMRLIEFASITPRIVSAGSPLQISAS